MPVNGNSTLPPDTAPVPRRGTLPSAVDSAAGDVSPTSDRHGSLPGGLTQKAFSKDSVKRRSVLSGIFKKKKDKHADKDK